MRSLLATVVLLAAAGAWALPAAYQVPALAACGLLWGLSRPPRRQLGAGLAGLALATVGLGAAHWMERTGPAEGTWIAGARQSWGIWCHRLRSQAATTASTIDREALGRLDEGSRLELFQHLQRLSAGAGPPGLTLFLMRADGELTAWAGAGLLHEPDPRSLKPSGLTFQRGYSAVTFFATAPVGDPGGHRVVAGRSLANDRLPFAGGHETIWSVVDGAAQTGVDGGLIRIRADGCPTLLIRPESIARRRGLTGRDEGGQALAKPLWLRQAAATVFAWTLLGLALLRGGAGRPPASDAASDTASDATSDTAATARRPGTAAVLAAAGAAAWGRAFELSLPVNATLSLILGLAMWSLLRQRRASLQPRGQVLGGLGLVALATAAWVFQRFELRERLELRDLAASFGADGELFALRLLTALAALVLLALAAYRRGPAVSDGIAWLALAFLLAAGAAHDRPLAALPLLAVGAGLATRWLSGLDLGRRPAALGAVALLAATAGAVAWETAFREVFRQRLAGELLPRVAPPDDVEILAFHTTIQEHFDRYDLRQILPPLPQDAEPADVDPQDLAFVLWRDSPLPERDGASAVLVELAGDVRSSFSFGLPLDRDSQVSRTRSRWPVPPADAWRERGQIVGEAYLRLDGRIRGRLEYWFLARPGFRLEVSEIAELEAALLRGEPHRDEVDGLPRPVLFGLYDGGGRPILVPWVEQPPLPREALPIEGNGTSRGVVSTPTGRAYFAAAAGDDLVEVLYLPRLGGRQGLERVGTHALASLAVLILIGASGAVVLLPRGVGWRGLVERPLRSYSIRLLLVYSVLLLVPLATLHLILLRSFEDRLRREQETLGRDALDAARQILFDRLERQRRLEPGMTIDRVINREALEWVSGVVRHQVNFYWQGELYASSQQELFTAGLLPRRIPGDIFARLALLGHEVGGRTQRTGDVVYQELYAPLPGPSSAAQGLFLSVPLLEQEEEVARELAALRRRAVLVTSAIVLLLLGVGSRLAASFTKPIMELIEGTRRIAGGAAYLDVVPRERELEALADAIDVMARRVAEARARLLNEKQVVERMVENINSGVVSLDHRRCVLLHNRLASDLLGTAIGVPIDTVLAATERLAPVAAFLEGTEPRDEIRHATVQLVDVAGETRDWTLTWVPLPGVDDPAALLVVDDDTEVLRAQRLEAWAEMARIIAHEIKNPLTPIRLSAEHLRKVWERDPDRLDEILVRCTDNILAQVEELRDIASDFSIYSRIPRAELALGDLLATLRELVESYVDTAPSGVELDFSTDLASLEVRFDGKLLVRAVRNLLENALRASGSTMEKHRPEGRNGRVVLAVGRSGEDAVISVLDSGPGVDPELLPRIFEPYFSTHETGTGLGLAISRRIVEEHGGRLEARNQASGGLEVTMTLPLPDTMSATKPENI